MDKFLDGLAMVILVVSSAIFGGLLGLGLYWLFTEETTLVLMTLLLIGFLWSFSRYFDATKDYE